MEKAYNFKEEKKWYTIWTENELFKADNESAAAPFSIILPPPLETHPLHMGHAFIFTIPDIIIRRKKMQGFNTLWLPGLNHHDTAAGLRELMSQLGLAVDWTRMKFTSPKEISKSVTKIFLQLYHQGEIYRKATAAKQWFLKASRIAKPAIRAVEEGEITFIPEKWANLYLNWMHNLQDWCISCQSGGGHRIPAYYCNNCRHLMVEEEPPGNCAKCGSTDIQSDPEVLDNWFLSALYPFAPLGWQGNSRDFAVFYPTSLMFTGFDTFFLQVPRMILMGAHFNKEVPFREVLVNGLTRVKKDQKRDDTGNNVSNPLEVIERYSADALRFTLAVQANPGMDITPSITRVKGDMTFANKIWNAARYIITNLKGDENFNIDFAKITVTDKWILHTLNTTIVKVNDLMDNYRINEAANLIYHFSRHEYCDWYLEFSKKIGAAPTGKHGIHKPDTRKTLKFTLFTLLQLLHPFMPFITEELFQKIKDNEKNFLLQTQYPAFNSELVFSPEFTEVEVLKKVIAETRKIRTENKIPPNKPVHTYLKTESPKEGNGLSKNMTYFNALTHSASTEIVPDFTNLPKGFRGTCLNWEILLPFDNNKERFKEVDRLKKELEKIAKQITNLEKKLSSDRFLDKSPKSVVLNLKKNLQEKIDKRNKIQKTIDDLS